MIHLDTIVLPVPQWYRIPEEDAPRLQGVDDEDVWRDYLNRHDGELPIIGVDDDTPLTPDEAMQIASVYGGGEFDDEIGGIVSALCRLRDEIEARS